MSSFGFGSGFGASQAAQSPFGSTAPSPFGTPQSVFGQQPQSSSPFGASSSGGIFGASTPAFGAAQTPAFGAASSAAFGSSSFGAKPSGGFGGFAGGTIATGSSPFGSSQPAFGASSTPAFGAAQSTPAFGAQPFGNAAASPFGGAGGTFGAASTPAFGAAAFGAASTPAFGSTGFGTGFGQQGFGMQQPQQQGTRNLTYSKVPETEGGTGSASSTKTSVYFCSILALPQFRDGNEKSAAELRWEDYQAGVKGNPSGGAGGVFGQASPAFGAPQASPFGATPSFGQASTLAFGQASMPAFGQASAPAFGSTFGQASGAFGSSTPSLFGGKAASSPAFGSSPFGASAPFGASSTPAFGQSSSAFGSSTPTFGQTSPAFGSTGFGSTFASSTPAFGTPQSSSAFGGGGLFGGSATSQPFGGGGGGFSFGQASSSGFSFANSTPPFGQSAAAPAFGASSSPAGGFNFGQAASTPAFGGGLFSQSASKPFGSLGASQPFGATSPSPFGTPPGGGLFGASSAAFGAGGLFGSQQTGGSNLFSFAQQPQMGSQSQAGQQQQMGLMQLPGVSTSPYGTLPAAPQVGGEAGAPLAEYRVGISQRPVSGLMSSRTMALMSPRNITPRAGFLARPLTTRSRTPRRVSSSPANSLQDPAADANGSVSGGAVFAARDNPRAFFVRDALPSTEGPMTSSLSPSHLTPRASQEDQATSNGEQVSTQPRGLPRPANGTAHGAGPSTARESPSEQAQRQRRGSSSRLDEDEDVGVREGQERRRSQAQHLTDEEISKVLPKVSRPHVYIEPSLTQLAAMAREDEQSLASVANFKVGHRQYGSVRWQEPVDVRGVDLDTAVLFSKGSVEVYFDDNKKPEIGQGLNKPAEVTLLAVYKADKATGRPTTDPAAVEKFVKRLKSTAASQNARFIGYQAEGGVWQFQVDHFSKYGLQGGSDSEDEQPVGMPQASAEAAGAYMQEDAAVGMQEGDEVEGPLTDPDHPMDEDADADSPPPVLDSAARRLATSPNLAHSLPATLDLEPAQLARLRDSLYPPGDQGEGLPQRPSKRRTAEGLKAPRRDAPGTTLEGRAVGQKPAAMPSAEPAAGRRTAPRAWMTHASAIQPPVKSAPSGLTGAEVSPQGASQSCLVSSKHKAAEAGETRNLVDAGAFMRRSFRVGWGPNNTFVHPASVELASNLALKQLKMNTMFRRPSEDAGGKSRERWRQLLELHSQSSVPEEGEDGEECQAVPRWRLQCSRVRQLSALCTSFQQVARDHYHEMQPQKGSLEEVCLRHEMQIWELVSVLYADIPSEQRPAIDDADEDMERGPQQAASDSRLVAFKRRAGLSRWFRDRATPEVEQGLRANGSVLRKIALLLSGQKLADAAALASASGHVRLATLIVQAGASAQARQAMAAQVVLWERNSLDGKIDPELLNIYRLLAGDAAPLAAALSLDWRRAFALHLWYSREDSPAAALGSYLEATSSAKAAPDPLPLYAEQLGWLPGQRRTADLAFTLLQLFTGRLSLGNQADVAQLLAPEGLTPKPLAALLPWLLLQVLQAIGAAASMPATLMQEMMGVGDLVCQLHTLGGLPEWEVYAAMHLPTHGHPDWRDARAQAVHDLLLRNGPHWAASPASRHFLRRLRVPPEWVAEARSIWARYSGNKPEELELLLEAGQWAAAHKLLVDSLAPGWFLSHQTDALLGSLRQLVPHSKEIDARAPGSFRLGAGLYLAYLSLQDMHAGGEEEADLADVEQFTVQLNGAADQPRAQQPDIAFYRVLARMAGDAAHWLTRGRRAQVQERQRLLLRLSPLLPAPRLSSLQLCAATVAEASA